MKHTTKGSTETNGENENNTTQLSWVTTKCMARAGKESEKKRLEHNHKSRYNDVT